MADDASAFAELGLGPDADSAEIERAYKRLIKEHHRDRQGGDARRAAEINRAYRELRAGRDLKEPLEFNEIWPDEPSAEPRSWPALAVTGIAAAAVLLLFMGPIGPVADTLRAPVLHRFGAAGAKAAAADPMEQALHVGAIAAAARRAQYLAANRDEMALARQSRLSPRTSARAQPASAGSLRRVR